MTQALTSQMNIRIGSSLKQRGDVALAQMGYTASEVVRAIWALAASGADGMEVLKGVLAQGVMAERGEQTQAASASAELMPWELYGHYVERLGVKCEIVPTVCSDAELLEDEAFGRMREKGLL